MTGQLGDATTVTIPPGQGAQTGAPVMVTEYMPGGDGAQVINTGTSGTLLLGTNSQIGPQSAVPVPAGASVQWTADGQLWAMAAADADSPIIVVISDLISAWQASPEAVGLAVSEQLIESGVPALLIEEALLTGQPIAAGQTVTVDISGSASWILSAVGQSGVCLDWQQVLNTPGGTIIVDQDTIAGLGPNVRIATVAPTLRITPRGGFPILCTVISSNRPPLARVDGSNNTDVATQYAGTIGKGGAAGTVTPLPIVGSAQLAGPAYATFSVGAGVTGRFELYYPVFGGAPLPIPICDTGEMAAASAGGLIATQKRIALPRAIDFAIQFRQESAATAAAGALAYIAAA